MKVIDQDDDSRLLTRISAPLLPWPRWCQPHTDPDLCPSPTLTQMMTAASWPGSLPLSYLDPDDASCVLTRISAPLLPWSRWWQPPPDPDLSWWPPAQHKFSLKGLLHDIFSERKWFFWMKYSIRYLFIFLNFHLDMEFSKSRSNLSLQLITIQHVQCKHIFGSKFLIHCEAHWQKLKK